MSFSIYLANLLNDHVLLNQVYTPPTEVWVAVFTSAGGLRSNILASQTEVIEASYTRLPIDSILLSFTQAVDGVSSNVEDWIFPTALTDWGILTFVAVMDAATAGNVLIYDPIGTARDIRTNDTLNFPAGSLRSTNL